MLTCEFGDDGETSESIRTTQNDTGRRTSRNQRCQFVLS
jgi:hypothetical protein